MATVVLEFDEDMQVAMARALVEAPQSALVAVAHPETREGHLVMADSYQEAVEYAQSHIALGWRAVVYEVPNRR